jgi:hypothetical protein
MLPKDSNENWDKERKVTSTRPAGQHFVQDDTKRPKVCFKAVVPSKKNLWGRKCRCTNTAVREIRVLSGAVEEPGHTEVAENNMSICVNENILWLDVSVYDIAGMNVLDGKELNEKLTGGAII